MNKITGNLAVKAFTIILLLASVIIMTISGMGLIISIDKDYFDLGIEAAKTRSVDRIASQMSVEAFYFNYSRDNAEGKISDNGYVLPGTNFYYEIKDRSGKSVAGRKPEFAPYYFSKQEVSDSGWYQDYESGQEIQYDSGVYTVYGYVDGSMPIQDQFYYNELALRYLYPNRFNLIWATLGSLALVLILTIFLSVCAGRRSGDKEIRARWFDRVPYDLVLAAAVLVVIGLLIVVSEPLNFLSYAYGNNYYVTYELIVISLAFLAGLMLMTAFWMTTVVRIKTRSLFKNTLIYKLILRPLKKLGSKLLFIFRNLPYVWKVVLILFGWFSLEFLGIVITAYSPGIQAFLWFISRIIASVVILLIAAGMTVIRRGGKELAAGKLNHKVETKYLSGDLKRHAEDLNSISHGMSLAVDEMMRSERFKTELITNVSHDIKTPLTSIINYADLLRRVETDDEKIKEYVEIINHHSNRLKKLTEDLVEASKASTGNIQTELIPCEVGVLLSQVTGEYEEKLSGCDLQLISDKPEYPVYVMADGRLLWRVIDNLLNNTCKYSQPGTRVYVSLSVRQQRAIIMVRNISRFQLNISSEELMERFVRGDSSRSTEGSGLGLSIARSLSELQGAEFNLDIDGDLFKAIVSFPLLPNQYQYQQAASNGFSEQADSSDGKSAEAFESVSETAIDPV